jgi:MHS family proline/betaine transporter-like MFS transporter
MVPKETLASSGMFLNTGFMALLIVLFPLMGLAADRFGKERLMIGSTILCFISAFPLFFLITSDNSLINILFILFVFAIFSGAFVAPSVSFLPTLFPPQERYSAMAMAVGFGEALGGVTPLICHGFVVSLRQACLI